MSTRQRSQAVRRKYAFIKAHNLAAMHGGASAERITWSPV